MTRRFETKVKLKRFYKIYMFLNYVYDYVLNYVYDYVYDYVFDYVFKRYRFYKRYMFQKRPQMARASIQGRHKSSKRKIYDQRY